METLVIVLLFVLGLVLTVKGGDLFVDASVWLAEASGIPKFIIGATVVSLCTTLPELLVSLMASASGSVGICVGNAVGSVTANIGLIMAISLVYSAGVVRRREQAFKYAMMTVAIALLLGSSVRGKLARPGAIALLILFAANMAESIIAAKRARDTADDDARLDSNRRTLALNLGKFALGVAGIVIGARLLVDKGTSLAQLLGVPDSIIGATLVAIGTSLPELVTTLTALAKKQTSLSIGNVIGANIIDLTLILPLCSLVSGKALPMLRQNILLDMPFCFLLVLLAVIPPLLTRRFHRWQGILMLVFYAVYVGLLVSGIAA